MVIILVAFGGFLVYWLGFRGSVFDPTPPAPPPEYAEGYAIIQFQDPLNEVIVTEVDLYIQFRNGTNYLNTTSGTTFYVPEASWFFAVKAGYWNLTGSVYAQGDAPGDAHIQTYSLTQIAPKNNVQFLISAIDGVYGTYSSSEIPDGYHTILISYSITGDWCYNSSWGDSSWVPDMFIPIGSYADQYNISITGLWIGWNGSITDYSLGGSPVGYYLVYDVGVCNSTHFYGIAFSGQLQVSGVFSNISNATIYFGLLDDTNNLVIHF